MRDREDQFQGDHRSRQEKETAQVVFNPQSGILDLRNLQASHLTSHRETTIPPMGNQEEEMRHQELKGEILALTKEYRDSKCDKKSIPKHSTFTKDALQGIQDLKTLTKEKDLILLPTDKSGSLSLNTHANYVHQTTKHSEKDTIVTQADIAKKERLLNSATCQLARALGVASTCSDNQSTSIKSALTNSKIDPPNLYCPPKDHKALEPGLEHLGPPNRPICGAREASNAQLSMLCSKVIHMAVEAEKQLHPPYESKSTEDVVAILKNFNEQRRDQLPETRGDTVLGSMDVASLYPSLDKDEDSRTAGEMITRHAHLLTSFNWVEGARFLALTLSCDQISHHGLTAVVHTRKHKGGAIPGITTPETATPLHHEILEDCSKLTPPSREATEIERANILGVVVATATRMSMHEHTYTFNHEHHQQSSGGPMGDTVSVEQSRATLLDWNIQLRVKFNEQVKKLRQENDVCKIYVDDHIGTYLAQPPVTRWLHDFSALIIDPSKVEEDSLIPKDARTMRLVRELANSINPWIRMVEDCPSKNPGGEMPVLDLQCWVDPDGFLRWEHFRKPMANIQVPLAVSALPDKIKRTSHSQEGVRILRNCCVELEWSEKAKHLTDLMRRLKISGYNHRY